MNIIKNNKKDIIIFTIILIFSLLIFGNYIIGHFATDTYGIFLKGYEKYAINNSFLDGRIFMGAIGFLANTINISIVTFSNILLVLAIITSCLTIMILRNIVLKYKKINTKWESAFITIICYYTIFHFLYMDNLYFVEDFVMALSLLFYILAAKCLVENKKYSIIITLTLLLMGVMSYQGTISMFYICVILFSMLNNCNYKEIIKIFLKSILIGVVAVSINYFEIKAVEKVFNITQTRSFEGVNDLINNIIIIIYYSFEVICRTACLFPRYLYIAFLIIIIIETICKAIKDRNKNGDNKKLEILMIEQIVLAITGIGLSYIPSIMHTSGFGSGRIRFSMGATIGILFIHLFVKSDISIKKTIINKVLILTFLIYAILNSVNYVYLTDLNKKTNELDRQNVYEIDEYMKEYERTNNCEIKYTEIIIDDENEEKAYYEELNSQGIQLAASAIRTQWSATGCINYYTNRQLKEKDYSPEDEELYLQNVDNRGYLCIGDTLYISIYYY